jgi:hypothetical protein
MINGIKYMLMAVISHGLNNEMLKQESERLFKEIKQRELQKFAIRQVKKFNESPKELVESDYQAMLFLYKEIYDRKKQGAVQSALLDIRVNVNEVLTYYDYYSSLFTQTLGKLANTVVAIDIDKWALFSKYKFNPSWTLIKPAPKISEEEQY